MKKAICVFLTVAMAVCVFSSCRPDTYELSESQMDDLISMPADPSNKIRPPKADILGDYAIKGRDENSDNKEWTAHVSERGGKILLQIYLPDKSPKTVTEAILEKVTSNYDQTTGRFEQTYVATEYTSFYEAFFSVEGKKIKIDLHNTFFYNAEGTVYAGIKAMGYKMT